MKLSGLEIMITGAAGFIGSHLADRLAEDNELILVDDFSIGRRENLERVAGRSSVRIVETDVTDRAAMAELCLGVDVVYHMAISCLRTSLNDPWLNHDVNAGGTLSVGLAARDAGVRRFVYVSSSEIYGSAVTVPMAETHPLNPITVYGGSKLAGEHYALAMFRTYGLPVSVVRPFNCYGPRAPYEGARAEVIPRFILQLQAGRSPVIYGDGSQTRDFTYVDDIVTGLVQAGGCDALVGEIVNIAYGREVSVRRIVELLSELVPGPGAAAVEAEPRPGDVQRHFADTTKAQGLFGFEAQTGIEDGLRRTVDWFVGQRVADRVDGRASSLPNW